MKTTHMPFILSPEQGVVANLLRYHASSKIKYFDIVTAMEAISLGLADAIHDGKKILIHLPQGMDQSTFRTMLAATRLDELAINISDTNPISELDVVKLRSSYKTKIDPEVIIKRELDTRRYAAQQNTIQAQYEALNAKVYGGTSYYTMMNNFIYTLPLEVQNTSRSQQNLSLEYSPNEYHQIKSMVEKAATLYNLQFELYTEMQLFSPKFWNETGKDQIEGNKKSIQELLYEAQTLQQQYQTLKNKLSDKAEIKFTDRISHCNAIIEVQQKRCISHKISADLQWEEKASFSIFKKKKKDPNAIFIEAVQEVASSMLDFSDNAADAPDVAEVHDYDSAMDYLTACTQYLAKGQSEWTKNYNQSFLRINSINADDPMVKTLDKGLNTILAKMESTGLFAKSFDGNILSLEKQTAHVDAIVRYLQQCDIFVHHNEAYFEWTKFYNSTSDAFKAFFTEHKQTPTASWGSRFDVWYFSKLYTHKKPQIKDFGNYLKETFHTLQEVKSGYIPAIILKMQEQRQAAAETLKEDNKDLYNTLFKKKQLPTSTWNGLTLMCRDFLKAYFPIHTCTNLSNINEYDVVISFDTAQETASDKVHFVTQITAEDIQGSHDEHTYFLYLNHYNYNTTLAKMPSVDKLKAAKKLAKFLLSLNQGIKMYQCKYANIISLITPQDDAMLLKCMDQYGIKEIEVEQSLYERLVECILITERQPQLIIKEHSINPELGDHAMWQHQVIGLFEKAGFEIQSLNIDAQISNNEAVFSDLVARIVKEETETSKEQNTTPATEAPKEATTELA